MGFLGSIGDAIGGAVSSVGGALEDVGDFAYNAQKNIIGGARSAVDSTLANADDIFKTTTKTLYDMSFRNPMHAAGAIVSDPFDVSNYGKLAADDYNSFNREGKDLFGQGGWVKAGANMFSTGNPFVGAGNLGYQAYDAATGNQYDGGLTSGISTLSGMYNVGNSLFGTPSAPSSPDLNVVPSDVASTGTPNVDYQPFEYTPGYDTNAATGLNAGVGDTSGLNFAGGTTGSMSPLLGTSTTNPGYDFSSLGSSYNSIMQGLNTPTGRAATTALGAVSPEAGALGSLAQGVASGDWSPAVKSLAQLYLTNRAKANANQYVNSMNQRVNDINNQFSLNGDLAKGMEQQLARRDAAAGRRSQYGPRSVDLAAKLAELRAQQTSPILNALGNQQMWAANQAKTQADNERMQTLLQAYGMYNKPQFSTPTPTPAGGTGLSIPGNFDLSKIWSTQ